MDFIAGMYLLVEGIRDFRTKEISPWICFGVGCVGLIYSIGIGRTLSGLLMGLIPGVVCLILSFCTRQAVGYGDGLLLCCLGMVYSLGDMVCVCMIALILAGIMALVLLVVFHKNGKYEIPFVPFLFLGWLFLLGAKVIHGGF